MIKKIISIISLATMTITICMNGIVVKGETLENQNIIEDNNIQLPSQVDNSQSKYFPPVGHQGEIGSCVSFSTAYYQLSYMLNKEYDRDGKLPENICSPTFIYNYSTHQACCEGIYDVMKQIGCCNIEDVPIVNVQSDIKGNLNWNVSEDNLLKASENRILNYEVVNFQENEEKKETFITGPKDSSLNRIKGYLNDGEILSFGTDIYKAVEYKIVKNEEVSENSKHIDEIIIPRFDKTKDCGFHEMTIVGYNDDIWVDINEDGKVQEGEKGAFKVVNSWGEEYANKGFVWMSYDAFNNVSSVNNDMLSSTRYVASDSYVRISVKDNKKMCKYYCEIELESASRGGISLEVTNKENGKTIDLYPFSHGWGIYNFEGEKGYSSGKFLFNLDNIIDGDIDLEDINNLNINVKVTDKISEGDITKIKDFRIIDKDKNLIYGGEFSNNVYLDGEVFNINPSLGYDKENKVNNVSKIYYKGDKKPAYVEYQVGDMNWITYSLLDMKEANYIGEGFLGTNIFLGKYNSAYIRFLDEKKEYIDDGYIYKVNTGVNKLSKKEVTTDDDIMKFQIPNMQINAAGECIYIKVGSTLDDGSVKFKYSYKKEGSDEEVLISDYSDEKEAETTISENGKYIITVNAIDKDGNETSYSKEYIKTDEYNSEYCKIESFVSTKGKTIKVNDTTEFNINVDDISMLDRYIVYVNGEKIHDKTDGGREGIKWTPTKAGEYTIKCVVCNRFEERQKTEKEMKIKVIDDYTEDMKIDITSEKGNNLKLGESSNILINVENTRGYFNVDLSINGENVLMSSDYDNYMWVPKEPGVYKITGKAKDDKGNESTNEIIVNVSEEGSVGKFQITPNSKGYKGKDVILDTYLEGQNNLEYKYICENIYTKEIKVLKDYSNISSYKWVPSEVGEYIITCFVKNNVFTASRSVDYTVTEPPVEPVVINKITTDDNLLGKVNKQVNILVDAKGGDGELDYKFEVINNTTKEKETLIGDKNKSKWQPQKAGIYTIKVTASDKDGRSSIKEINYEVAKMDFSVQIGMSKEENILVGDNITFDIRAINEDGKNNNDELTYKLIITNKNTNDSEALNVENNKVSWIAKSKGSYVLKATITDIDGKTSGKELEFNVTKKPLNVYLKSSKVDNIFVGDEIDFNTIVENEDGKCKYAYYVDGMIVNNENKDSAKLTFSNSGEHSIFVEVTEEDGNKVKSNEIILNVSEDKPKDDKLEEDKLEEDKSEEDKSNEDKKGDDTKTYDNTAPLEISLALILSYIALNKCKKKFTIVF